MPSRRDPEGDIAVPIDVTEILHDINFPLIRRPNIEKPSIAAENKSAKAVLGLGDKTVTHFA